jgi:fumarylacetoacetase
MTDISKLTSFVPVEKGSDFPIQNLPYGIFKMKGEDDDKYRVCTAIGNYVLDLNALYEDGIFEETEIAEYNPFNYSFLNCFMSLGKKTWSSVRNKLLEILAEENPQLKDNEALREKALIPIDKVIMKRPAEIGDYTDFYSSKEHATNVGIMFRGKENALMPNWLHLPVAYHGRASSIILSGEDIHRPKGQTKADDSENPSFGPSKLLDFELEMGFFIGPGNKLGHPVNVSNAEEHIFGMVIVNDWSARDIQKWEYVPLGPFLAKNFATSISPWVVTLEALEPFRTSSPQHEKEPPEYLKDNRNCTYDIKLDVYLQSSDMAEPMRICESNFKYLYWSMCQQLAHHTVTGCNLQPGDLLASGTISGADKSSFGSMLELTWRGSEPIKLSNGQERKFLQDGDTVIMKAYCQKGDFRIGFGEVSTKILPAID